MKAAQKDGVHLLVTPELAISGYSLEDRIHWPDIMLQSWATLTELAEESKDMFCFIGLPVRLGPLTYNAAALIGNGKIHGLILKKNMPSYSIFYEGRNWNEWEGGVTEINGVPAGDLVFDLPFGKVTAEICEDLWTANPPALARVRQGAEIVCNPSASPFTPRKNQERKRLILGAANSLKSIYAYANILGCDNSRLVFDGGGIIATPDTIVTQGEILSKKNWTLASGIVDLDDLTRMRAENTTWRTASNDSGDAIDTIKAEGTFKPAKLADYVAQMPQSFYAPNTTKPKSKADKRNAYLDELFDGLVLGMRDYFEKVGAFQRYLIALSGGRDSALCLLIAVEASKWMNEGKDKKTYADRINTLYLPNKAYSTSGTENAARAMADELGVPFQIVSISEESALAKEKAAEILGDEKLIHHLALQNLQARVRGNMVLNWGNSVGGLVLVTSNLSEAAVGYTTTGGDNEGGFSPIANIPKSLISELLAYLAERDGLKSVKDVLAIPPSAELADDQKDEDDLMPYVVLDDLLYLYARKRLSLANTWQIACLRHPDYDPEQVRAWTADFARRFAQNQWKRDQHPVSLKVMDLDLDPKTGFRFPVTQSIQHELDDLDKAKLPK